MRPDGTAGAKVEIPMKNQSFFKLTAFITVLLGALVFSGCHTMEGAGKDIQKAGDKLEDAAK